MCRWETNSLPLCVCVCIRVLERLWLAKLSAADKVPVFSHCCAVSRPPAWHTEPSDQFGLVGAYTDSSSPLWLVGLLCCQTLSKAEDTRGRKPAPIFGVENRSRFAWHMFRKSAPVFDPVRLQPKRRMDGRTDSPAVCTSIRLLDGVWHLRLWGLKPKILCWAPLHIQHKVQ